MHSYSDNCDCASCEAIRDLQDQAAIEEHDAISDAMCEAYFADLNVCRFDCDPDAPCSEECRQAIGT